jgi:hypothetical protein
VLVGQARRAHLLALGLAELAEWGQRHLHLSPHAVHLPSEKLDVCTDVGQASRQVPPLLAFLLPLPGVAPPLALPRLLGGQRCGFSGGWLRKGLPLLLLLLLVAAPRQQRLSGPRCARWRRRRLRPTGRLLLLRQLQ